MATDTPGYNPFRSYGLIAASWLELSRDLQEDALRRAERWAAGGPFGVEWATMTIPAPTLRGLGDAEQMREAFHHAADLNLRLWEHTANVLSAMPMWSHAPMRVPGTVLTDWFDRMRKMAVETPANDAWAEPAPAASAKTAGPERLAAPEGAPDDLTAIKGIGPKLSAQLNELGVFHYRQIAAWTPADGEWIDEYLAFKGRVARENWVEQAAALMTDTAA